MLKITIKINLTIIVLLALTSCDWWVKRQIDNDYGSPVSVNRITANADANLFFQAKHIIDHRCVVCHACYDAPCQLKLGSIDSINRGANDVPIYDAHRMLVTPSSHFYEDGATNEDWRNEGFFPVLNERQQTPQANLDLSLIYRFLQLKNEHSLSDEVLLPDDFDVSLKRPQFCPKIETFAGFKSDHPLWGMPYGLPAINEHEFSVIVKWLEQGAQAPIKPALSAELKIQVDKWESFFNGQSLKEKLVNRYLYEHLYFAHLYFDELDVDKNHSPKFFRMVRSFTPSGKAIEVMPMRRPYDPPLDKNFYYRLQEIDSTIVAKTHMPYVLNAERYLLWDALFYKTSYEVKKLPSYDAEISSNPFIVFEAIPMASRYKFLLEEAHFSIMNFIKGPVCRGQIAVSVIADHFWVVFANPDLPDLAKEEKFLQENSELLRFPAYWESLGNPWSWIDLAQRQQQYVQAKAVFMNQYFAENTPVNLNVVWSGYQGKNANAALTILRHSDSATVLKGFVGNNPQSAWLIDYPLLERIHYLLVAGFDVNGSVVHQVSTRLYMDFLRMEGEANFIALLPKNQRQKILQEWYLDADENVKDYFSSLLTSFTADSAIEFTRQNTSQDINNELQEMLAQLTQANRYLINAENYPDVDINLFDKINSVSGLNNSFMPQTAIVEVQAKQNSYWFTIIRHNVYKNKTHLLTEDQVRVPDKDSLSITPEIISAYPNALYQVQAENLADFVQKIQHIQNESDYFALMNKYGVRRTNKNFWAFSDKMHEHYKKTAGLEYGLLDYNRLENR